MKPFSVLVALAGFSLLAAACVPPPPPPPSPISCGTVIATNVVLQQDLTCSGDGLLVGAGNITIDLNGHTISGGGTSGCGQPFLSSAGVRGTETSRVGFSGVTVKNGTIQGFSAGILSDFLSASNYVGLRLLNNTCGYASTLRNVDRGQIAFSLLSGNGAGIFQSSDTGKITVTRSVLAHNGGGIGG